MRYPALLVLATLTAFGAPSAWPVKPDFTVAADGRGDFKTVQGAVASIPKDNRERRLIFVKDGVYHEKIRVDASYVTLRGESRAGTRIEFPQAASDYRGANRDNLGQAVLNINGDDFVLENLTVQNTHGVIGTHAFAIYGRGDRTVLEDADILSQGNDTLSLWRTANGQFSEDAAHHSSPNGRYYHARLKVCGSVDFVCPRGWCYMTDCDLFEVNPKAEAAMWHDGSRDQDMKFVMTHCRFDGVEGWRFARHHHDAAIYVLDSTLSKTLRDAQPKRVMYPLDGSTPTEADLKKNKDADPSNIWGERFLYFNVHRDGGDYAWHANNLTTLKPADITAKWTFAGKWDPENTTGPAITSITRADKKLTVTFSESVTVKGHPQLWFKSGGYADYTTGSGTDTLSFDSAGETSSPVTKLDFHGGTIIATEASAQLRVADRKLPTP